MWPLCLLFVHLGHCACIHIGCLLVEEEEEGGGSTRHIPGNTFQSAAAAAWRGKAVKAARPLCLPPYGLRCSSPPPSYSPAWPPDSAGRRWLPLWGPWTPSRGAAACRGSRAALLDPVEQEMSVNLQLLLNRTDMS